MDGGADRARPPGRAGRTGGRDRSGHELDPAPRARAPRYGRAIRWRSPATWCITRLGQGVDETGRLDPAAIDRAVHGDRPVHPPRPRPARRAGSRIGATSAVRDAAEPGCVPLARPRRDEHRAGGDRRRARGRALVPRRDARARSRRRAVPPGRHRRRIHRVRLRTGTDGRRPRALDTDGERPAHRAGPALGPSVRRGPRGVRRVDRAASRRGRASGARSGRPHARRRRRGRRPRSRRARSVSSATTPT